MKVRDFWNSLPNKSEMMSKIKDFKEQKRRETFLARFENCQICSAPIRFAHSSYYMQNLIVENACCPGCGQSAPERSYSIN
jgi:hypothetical protein